jgi:hypothetical protein
MNLVLTLLCLTICVADFAQLVVGPIAPGPMVGGALYLLLAVGTRRRHVLAQWVVLMMPIVPLVALGASALGVFNLTTPWTVPVFALQLAAAGLAGVALWQGSGESSHNR